MRFFYTILCLGFLHVTAQSQQVKLLGVVVNNNDQPLPFSTIRLFLSSDTQNVKFQKIANDDGSFLLPVDRFETYLVKVSSAEYKDAFSIIKIDSSDYDIGRLKLFPFGEELSEVVVVSKKPFITKKIDRLIMNVKENEATTGKNFLELLNMAPGVFVNRGNISINGTSGAKVMVNGKLLALSGDDLTNYLQNIEASNIERIEIMAQPPAEYDATGSGGLINIVLRKNETAGFSGSAAFDYGIGLGRFPKYNPSFNLGYQKGKFSLSANYAYSYQKAFSNIEQSRRLSDDQIYQSNTNSDYIRRSNNLRLEATYHINKRQYLSLYYDVQPQNGVDSIFSNSNILSAQPENNMISSGRFPNSFKSKYSNVGLNYDIQTDTLGSHFTLLADYTHYKKDGNSYTFSNTFDNNRNLISDTTFGFFFPNKSQIITANASYNKVFSKQLSFSVGGKLTQTEIINNNYYNIFSNGLWNRPDSLDINYRYYENIYAGYINLKGEFKNINFQIGLRGEQSNIDGQVNTAAGDTSQSKNYFNLFPTVYLQKTLSSKNNMVLSLSYNRRIERPTFSALTPFRYYIDNFSVQEGNPYLRPQFTNAWSSGLSIKNRYNFSLGYNYSNDILTTLIKTDSDDATMVITTDNVGSKKVLSANFSIPVNLAKWWSTTNNLLLTYTKSTSPDFSLERGSFVIQTVQDITLNKKMNLDVTAFYTPRVIAGNMLTNRISSVDLGFRVKLFNDKLIAKTAISDIFYMNNFKATSYYQGSQLNLNQKLQTRIFSLSFIYNFKMGKSFETRKIEKSNENEQQRLK